MLWYNQEHELHGFAKSSINLPRRQMLSFEERDDEMLCHMTIDLSVVLCAGSSDWTILVQR